jgi:hypothetical protein
MPALWRKQDRDFWDVLALRMSSHLGCPCTIIARRANPRSSTAPQRMQWQTDPGKRHHDSARTQRLQHTESIQGAVWNAKGQAFSVELVPDCLPPASPRLPTSGGRGSPPRLPPLLMNWCVCSFNSRLSVAFTWNQHECHTPAGVTPSVQYTTKN